MPLSFTVTEGGIGTGEQSGGEYVMKFAKSSKRTVSLELNWLV